MDYKEIAETLRDNTPDYCGSDDSVWDSWIELFQGFAEILAYEEGFNEDEFFAIVFEYWAEESIPKPQYVVQERAESGEWSMWNSYLATPMHRTRASAVRYAMKRKREQMLADRVRVLKGSEVVWSSHLTRRTEASMDAARKTITRTVKRTG